MKEDFIQAGVTQFGSGWCWLAVKDGKIVITKTPNGENPLVHGGKPILGCDVWEHSYYIDYRNRRPDYLKAFMDHLVNWEYVAKMFDAAASDRRSALDNRRWPIMHGQVGLAADCGHPALFSSMPRIGRRRAASATGSRIAVLGGVASSRLLTFRDYGLSWDDYAHAEYGDLLLDVLHLGIRGPARAVVREPLPLRRRLRSARRVARQGSAVHACSRRAGCWAPRSEFSVCLLTWRIGRRIGGPLAGLLALVLLAACPLYYGHMFMNPKDAPFAVAMAILLLGLVRAFEQYPRPSAGTIALVGIGFGLSFGSRIMGAFGAIAALAALALIFAVEARAERRSAGRRTRSGGSSGHARPRCAAGLCGDGAGLALGGDRSAQSVPRDRIFLAFLRKAMAGTVRRPADLRSRHAAQLRADAVRAQAAGGVLGCWHSAARPARIVAAFRRDVTLNRRAVFLLVALAALLPLAVTIALRPAMYNGIRHFVFVLPPLAVLGGLAGAVSARHRCADVRARCRSSAAAMLALGIALPVVAMVRMHPYEYTHFNRLAGGIAGAQHRYMLDYWGLAFKQASQALLQARRAARRNQAGGTAAGRSRSAARTARHRSSSAPISRPPGIRAAPTSP